MKTRRRQRQRQRHQLFNDAPDHRPRTKGIGYGTAKKARNSIKLLKGKPVSYQRQVATTMFFRAKYHKYQNQGMRDAMKGWDTYLQRLR